MKRPKLSRLKLPLMFLGEMRPHPAYVRTYQFGGFLGSLLALTFVGWGGFVSSVGAAFLIALLVGLIVNVLVWAKIAQKAAKAARVKREEEEDHELTPFNLSHTSAEDTEEYVIGDEAFYAAPLTKKVVQQVIDAQWEPSEDAIAGAFGGYSKLSKEDQRRWVDATYEQLSILLRDREGGNPDTEFLSLYLPMDRAAELLERLHPNTRKVGR